MDTKKAFSELVSKFGIEIFDGRLESLVSAMESIGFDESHLSSASALVRSCPDEFRYAVCCSEERYEGVLGRIRDLTGIGGDDVPMLISEIRSIFMIEPNDKVSVDGLEYTIHGGCAYVHDCIDDTEVVTVPSEISVNGSAIPVKGIGPGAFSTRENPRRIVISEGIIDIRRNAFEACEIESIEIPDTVEYIGECAFYACSNLETVTIPNGVVSIRMSAFSGCMSLRSVRMPDSITVIEDEAFEGCLLLEDVDLPNGLVTIGQSSFRSCSSLESVVIPQSVRTIGECAFRECGSLRRIELPDNIILLEEGLFNECTSLTDVKIPSSVTEIENHVFDGCEALESVTIPGNVVSIGDKAFFGCKSLESVTLSYGVESIGDYAFSHCRSLESMEIPGSVKDVGYDAFDRHTRVDRVSKHRSVD